MLKSLDLTVRQKVVIENVIDEACEMGIAPVWSSILQSQV
jgi:hypothetical protein